MTLEFVILGSGSSGGVPRLGGAGGGGDWGACDPKQSKNRRRRCSALVRTDGTQLLIDTSPDLREQLLAAQIAAIDGVLITHAHADQTNGIDDLRVLVQLMRRRVDLYTDGVTLARLKQQFDYCFDSSLDSGYPPILTGHAIVEPFGEFCLPGQGGVPVRPFWQSHGSTCSLGFRFGPLAYSSDVNGLDEEAFAVLEGVECWIVDALRYRVHPTHANVEMALAWIARVKPKRAILTNLHTDLDYDTLKRELPAGVEPAYDGMVISVPL